jgi:MFS family permease
MASNKRYQWLLIGLLSLNFGVVFFDRNAFAFLAPFIQPDLQLTNTQIGLIGSAFSFAWALSGLAMGGLSDRFGHRKAILIVATVVFSAASVLSGMASTFALMLGARMLMGVAEGGIMPITQTTLRPKSRRSGAAWRRASPRISAPTCWRISSVPC